MACDVVPWIRALVLAWILPCEYFAYFGRTLHTKAETLDELLSPLQLPFWAMNAPRGLDMGHTVCMASDYPLRGDAVPLMGFHRGGGDPDAFLASPCTVWVCLHSCRPSSHGPVPLMSRGMGRKGGTQARRTLDGQQCSASELYYLSHLRSCAHAPFGCKSGGSASSSLDIKGSSVISIGLRALFASTSYVLQLAFAMSSVSLRASLHSALVTWRVVALGGGLCI